MKVTFICAVFPPEPEPAGTMAQQLAERLSTDNTSVRMVVPYPNRPLGKIYRGYHRRLLGTIKETGTYQIVYCANWLLTKKRHAIDRLLENFTFGLTSVLGSWRAGRPDLLIVETWPLVAAQFAAAWALLLRVPFIYYLQDVYPEALEFAGQIQANGKLARLLRAWDRRICRSSRQIVTISQGVKDLLCESRQIPAEKVRVIPNWLDQSLFPAMPRENGWREGVGIPESKFLVLFAGTMGHVSGAEIILDVARYLREFRDIQILCVGEGVLKAGMVDAARAEDLSNVRFISFQAREQICMMHASADATLLTLRPGYPDASVPSKLITYLASGRPVICAAPSSSSAALEVAAAGAGVNVEPGESRAIGDAVLRLWRSPELVEKMGQNGRSHFLKHYTFERAYEQFRELLQNSLTSPS